jgi:hypothetical protein
VIDDMIVRDDVAVRADDKAGPKTANDVLPIWKCEAAWAGSGEILEEALEWRSLEGVLRPRDGLTAVTRSVKPGSAFAVLGTVLAAARLPLSNSEDAGLASTEVSNAVPASRAIADAAEMTVTRICFVVVGLLDALEHRGELCWGCVMTISTHSDEASRGDMLRCDGRNMGSST